MEIYKDVKQNDRAQNNFKFDSNLERHLAIYK